MHEKKLPFMRLQGGYIPMLDHAVPMDVPMKLFNFYLNYVRKCKKNMCRIRSTRL